MSRATLKRPLVGAPQMLLLWISNPACTRPLAMGASWTEVALFLAHTRPLIDGRGRHSTHLTNWSTIMRTYSLPALVLGSGPRKSRCTLSIGKLAWYSVEGCRDAGLTLFFIELHIPHVLTNLLICDPQQYHQYRCNLSLVRLIP
ncbi:hypothetical protein PoB_006081300 [Plakobranchus ocellatus]|uniref:Secreted protein n=1 Tax=Plakobranchus ocellatus TaxID=259542 RepID=A0AAV4CR14_9GAST|nr:hypothetical protein PoB_006081300 [Plakobranchus ocellatus]